ncbi:tetratricopeptide repeat protein [Pseudomonadota bacterium]
MDEWTEEALLPKAKKGDKDAQYRLGHYYDYGIRLGFDFDDVDGIPPDVYWYHKAAENGHSRAQRNLGHYYQDGIGVKRDLKQARYWRSKAKEQVQKSAKNKPEKEIISKQGVDDKPLPPKWILNKETGSFKRIGGSITYTSDQWRWISGEVSTGVAIDLPDNFMWIDKSQITIK